MAGSKHLELVKSSMAHQDNIPSLAPVEAFQLLQATWNAGRPIVPLFGAGLSIEAGVPTTSQIGEYLAKVARVLELNRGSESPSPFGEASQLVKHGWPDFFEVNDTLLSLSPKLPERSKLSTRRIIQDAVLFEVQTHFSETFGDAATLNPSLLHEERVFYRLLMNWRVLLRRLAAGDHSVCDTFYMKLTKGHKSGRSHVYASALVRLLGLKLLLTTNFDSLLEGALVNAGIQPHIIELPEHGDFPSPHAASTEVSVLKLHGGKFSIRFTDILDTTFDATAVRRFLEYLPPNALLLVLGYRGADRRVMGLIYEHIQQSQREGFSDSVLWVSKQLPSTVKSFCATLDAGVLKRSVHFCNYSSTTLFLQELCTRLRGVFPSQQRAYSALSQSPPITLPAWHREESREKMPHYTTEVERRVETTNQTEYVSAMIVFGMSPGAGTSTFLAELARQHERSHTIIWCDLEEIPSVDALVFFLEQRLHAYDPGIRHIVLSEDARDTEGLTDTDPLLQQPSCLARIPRLIAALRRGKYFVAIDSMNEFGRSYVGHDLLEPVSAIANQYEQLVSFLERLVGHAAKFGESIVSFVFSPVTANQPSHSAPALEAPPTDDGLAEFPLEVLDTVAQSPARLPMAAPNEPVVTAPYRSEDRAGATTLLVNAPRTTTRPPTQVTGTQPPHLAPNTPLGDQFSLGLRVVPEALGKYKVIRCRGEGTYGIVFQVRDEALSREFAAKVLKERWQFHPQVRALFLAEARKALLLTHPNVARIFYVEDRQDAPFIIYELVPRGSLERQIPNGIERLDWDPSLDLKRRMTIVSQVARALHYAHQTARLVHGDIKPANIMLDLTWDAKIVDLGFAVELDAEVRSIQLGSIPYMSPERHLDKRDLFGPLSDVFSLGVVMYELLAGRRPFANRDEIIAEREVSTFAACPSIPASLCHICDRCLKKNPGERYRSAEELAKALDAWLRTAAENDNEAISRNPNHDIQRVFHRALESFKEMARHSQPTVRICHPTETYGFNKEGKTAETVKRMVTDNVNIEHLCDRIVGSGNMGVHAVTVMWERLRFEHQAMLLIASAFRRPRSIIALRRIGSVLLRRQGGHVLSVLTKLSREDIDTTHEDSEIVHDAAEDLSPIVDRVLADLNEAGLLIRQEGGSYWMHTAVRDKIYRESEETEPQGMSNLHEIIAYYYYELVYRPSQDVSAFFEYVYHQLGAIRDAVPKHKPERLRALLGCLNRERTSLLSYAHLGSLLDWVRTIREVELPRLENIALPDDDQARAVKKELLAISRELSGFLLETEAAIHRRSTNYRQCIIIGLRQIGARIDDLLKNQTEPDLTRRLLAGFAQQLHGNLGRRQHRELCGHVTVGLRSLIAALTPFAEMSCVPTNGNCVEDIQKLASRLSEKPVPAAEVATDLRGLAAKARADSHSIMAPLIRSIVKLVDHIMEIAVCFHGLHYADEARDLYDEIKAFTTNVLAMMPPAGLRDAAAEMRSRASLRIVESLVGEIYTWETGDRAKYRMEEVRLEYQQAMNGLEKYPGALRSRHARHTCILKSSIARLLYLRGRFRQAYAVLENARAAVYRETGTEERLVLADCELKWSECFMLHANHTLTAGRAIVQNPAGKAKELLDSAWSSWSLAKDILSEYRGTVWRWTQLYLQEAQLIHELILLQFHDVHDVAGIDIDTFLLQGLYSIRAGIDNIAKDTVRLRYFLVLWWQFFICSAVRQNRSLKDCWANWSELCKRADLEVLFESQYSFKVLAHADLIEKPLAEIQLGFEGGCGRTRVIELERSILAT